MWYSSNLGDILVTFSPDSDISSDSAADLYGVATISRLLKSIGVFCKRALYRR